MDINDLKSSNLNRILKKLYKEHNVRLNLTLTERSLFSIYKNSATKINALLVESNNSFIYNREYSKHFLICEAIKLFLSEIAPIRGRKKVKSKKDQKKNTNKTNENLDNAKNVYSKDSPVSFDGEDMTDSYSFGRNPKNTGKPWIDHKYTKKDPWLSNIEELEPETGDPTIDDLDVDPGLVSFDTYVSDMYYSSDGPDPTDYALDRNVEYLKTQKTPEELYVNVDDVLSKPTPPGRLTKTGLPAELEQSFRHQTELRNLPLENPEYDPREREDERRVKTSIELLKKYK